MTLASIIESSLLKNIGFNEDSSKALIYAVSFANCKQNIPKFWECLSEAERAKAKGYYTSSLSERYIISHGILRYILSHYTSQLPQDIEFVHNTHGKPFLKNNNIQFNMSHSHNMISYVIALNYKVGIDIELQDDNFDADTMSDLVFTSQEAKLFAILEDARKLEFFYNLWVKKEALIKASGYGLSYPINTIEAITILAGEKIMLAANENNQLEQEWYYFPLELVEMTQQYFGAIAIECKVNQIIYVEMSNCSNIFDKIRVKYY